MIAAILTVVLCTAQGCDSSDLQVWKGPTDAELTSCAEMARGLTDAYKAMGQANKATCDIWENADPKWLAAQK
jgi:hypothetical protein